MSYNYKQLPKNLKQPMNILSNNEIAYFEDN